MRAAWMLTCGWAVLSLAWVVLVLTGEGHARDPSSWSTVCVLVAGMHATLLVFVVTLAPLWLQMQPHRPPRLAFHVLDASAVGYALFFMSGVLVPVLGALAPSRGMALLATAMVAPVVVSLVPAVAFFRARLQPGWLLRRPVERACGLLARSARRERGGARWERRGLEASREAALAVRLLLEHGGAPGDDRRVARQQGELLLGRAIEADTAGTRNFVIKRMRWWSALAAEQGSASLRREVTALLVNCGELAKGENGHDIVRAALNGLREMGRSDGWGRVAGTSLRALLGP